MYFIFLNCRMVDMSHLMKKRRFWTKLVFDLDNFVKAPFNSSCLYDLLLHQTT